jgi:hypothetical protein
VQNVGFFLPDLVHTASTSRGGTFCLLARLEGKGRREAIKKGGLPPSAYQAGSQLVVAAPRRQENPRPPSHCPGDKAEDEE